MERPLLLLPSVVLCWVLALQAARGQPAAGQAPFSPADSFLLDCGATTAATMPDGRPFKTDAQSAPYLSARDDNRASVPAAPGVPSPLYLSARVFTGDAAYAFPLSRPGWHWVRLHFYPVNNTQFDLTQAVFSVATDDYVLLHSFNPSGSGDAAATTTWALKEYLINANSPRLTLRFSPQRNSVAFVNGIEVVSAPDDLLSDTATALFPVGPVGGLSGFAYQTAYRLNVGGPEITPANDTLGRTWGKDTRFLQSRSAAERVSVSPGVVQYPDGTSNLVAPNWVYASAVKMADARVGRRNFNVTWNLDVDPSFAYLVRLHFCDIISKTLNDLYFNVYINGRMAISGLDLSTLTSALASAYYKDTVLNASVASDRIMVQVGPMSEDTGAVDALLNGVEVLKMSNSVGSLDGEFGVDGSEASGEGSSGLGSGRKAVAAVGFVMMFGAFAGLGAMVVKWYRRPQDWEKRNSFSSWLLPLHAGHSSFMTGKGSSYVGSHRSGFGGGGNFYSSTLGLGRYFSLSELQEATGNFDKEAVIGVGGFGNVYLGQLEEGTKVAVKRGNPQSEQGINEFQTEIQMLSKLRHRHLVSLMGYCDENAEMILVYEYMANGPFRDHLYGKDLPSLSWRQRLEICIGAARGLHYLHTGAAQGIIHRDVKTTNILLDDGFVAKVSDFGLSKDGPSMGAAHVSTAVKGSFGYLDPEYFRRQQLTDKSDVYSFGVVLLEALCARPAINPALPREQVNLAEWAMQWKRKGQLHKVVDPVLVGTLNLESMNKFAEAAEKCLAEHGVDRPSMGDVLWNLEYALQLHDAAPPTPPPGTAAAGDDDKGAGAPAAAAAAPSPDEPKSTAAPAEARPPAVHPGDNSGNAEENDLFAQLAGTKGR